MIAKKQVPAMADPFGYYSENDGLRQFELSADDILDMLDGGNREDLMRLLADRGFSIRDPIQCVKSYLRRESIIFTQKKEG